MRHYIAASLMTLCVISPVDVSAQDRQTLGYARQFTNDYFGDGRDRWRSGSYHFSIIRGEGWDGARPDQIGSLLEYRLRSEIITPERGLGGMDDRPYVGAISLGLHTHFALGQAAVSLGADVVAVGPQTGVSQFQEFYHDTLSMPAPPGANRQLDNAVYVSGTAELAWPLRLNDSVTLRPFAEAQAGVEDMVRVGADVMIGGVGHSDLMVRDVVTGQLMRAIEADVTGYSLVAGADWSQVWGSAFLPEAGGFQAQDSRWRARAGVHWQITDKISFFYGATYLSEEFVGQDEGQLLGGLKLNFNF